MATSFPGGLDSFTNPSATDAMDSVTVPHADQHANLNDAVEALEAKVGADGSAVTSSLDYKVAQQGLTLVKTQTVGSGVSNVQINSAFSSTFDNYKISISGITMSASTGNSMYVRLSSGGTTAVTNYQYAMAKVDIANGAITGVNAQNSSVMFIGKGVGDKFGTTFDVVMPYISTHTIFPNIGGIETSTGYAFSGIGQHQTTASYDGFRIQPLTGTITGGTIRVYGYNNG